MFKDIEGGKRSGALYLMPLVFLALLLIFSDLGDSRLPPIDDCYFSQKAKEMVQTGDWYTLRFAGKVSLDHGPFYIWLIALMFKVLGVSEFSARFFSAFFGVATIISVYFLGRMIFDRWVGLFSSFVLLTTSTFFIFSRRAMVDVTFTFWVTLAIIFFLKGMKRREYFILFGATTGITILTKSIIGCAPILIAGLYLVLLKEYKKLIDPFFLLGMGVTILVSAPWFLYQYSNYTKDFVDGHLKWLLYRSAVGHKRVTTPVWYLKTLLLVYWPWIPFAAYAFIKGVVKSFKKVDPAILILLCWTAAIIGIMSFMKVKKIHYIMSAFPPLAILSAVFLNTLLWNGKVKHFVMRSILVGLFIVVITIFFSPLKLPPQLRENNYFENLVDDTYTIALFAKEHFSKDEKIVLYQLWLWRIRSTYLFYSDRDVEHSIYDKEVLSNMLQEGSVRYCLTTKEKFAELLSFEAFRPEILKATSSLVLFSKAK